MASSHQHHNATCTTTTHGCFCCTHHPSPPSSSATADPLLQAFLSHFLLQQQQNQAAVAPPCHCQTHQKHHFQQQKKHFHYQQREPERDYQQEARLVLSSLLSRIDALEASLHKFSSSSSPHGHYSCSYSSRSLLRDAAARVIQTHFRAFLVRRSRTLRQLKHLAFIKSRFNSLKSSISKKTHIDFRLLSQKASDLLLKLDSIQGGDPMVRDGKRSISMELVKFLEFVDGFVVRRQQVSFKAAAKNVKIMGTGKNRTSYGDLGRDQNEMMENLRDRIEKINRVFKDENEDVELEGFHQLIDDDEEEEEEENPRVSRYRNGVLPKRVQVQAQPKVKKSVSFAENGNVVRVFGNESNSENGSSVSSEDDDGQVVVLSEVEATKGSEDGEEECLDNGEIVGNYKGEDGRFVFSAPLPVKMESRADIMKKRKAVKSVA